jgi:hypothetical protein
VTRLSLPSELTDSQPFAARWLTRSSRSGTGGRSDHFGHTPAPVVRADDDRVAHTEEREHHGEHTESSTTKTGSAGDHADVAATLRIQERELGGLELTRNLVRGICTAP